MPANVYADDRSKLIKSGIYFLLTASFTSVAIFSGSHIRGLSAFLGLTIAVITFFTLAFSFIFFFRHIKGFVNVMESYGNLLLIRSGYLFAFTIAIFGVSVVLLTGLVMLAPFGVSIVYDNTSFFSKLVNYLIEVPYFLVGSIFCFSFLRIKNEIGGFAYLFVLCGLIWAVYFVMSLLNPGFGFLLPQILLALSSILFLSYRS